MLVRLTKGFTRPRDQDGEPKRPRAVDWDLVRLGQDHVIWNEVRRHIAIIDVTVRFKNRLQAFNDSRGEKLQKYHPVAENLREKGYSVTVEKG